MQSVPEFGEFVTTRSPRLLRVAYLLTRDWALAEDLLQTALVKAWSAWKRIETDPEAYVRRILVTTYCSWWRQAWRHERPTENIPENPSADAHDRLAERERMLQALARLPHRQRAVLVLRFYEDLPEAEIADILGITSGTVKSLAANGLANLRVDALLYDEPSTHHVRLAAVAHRVRVRRRRTAAIVGTACAVIIAIILGYALSPAHRASPHPRPLTTASPRQIGGLPQYYDGAHVTQVVTLTRDHPWAQITWMPGAGGGTRFSKCHIPTPTYPIWYSVEDGDSVGGFTCDTLINDVILRHDQQPTTTPVTLTIRLDGARDSDGRPVPIPADFSLSWGVGDTVDWSEYTFPPRPDRLPLLAWMSGRTTRVTSDSTDPMAPRTIRFRQPQQLTVQADGTGPTRLHLSINGVELLDYRKWSYDQRAIPTTFERDDAGIFVTLTITPEYATGPWAVDLAQACSDPVCPPLSTTDG